MLMDKFRNNMKPILYVVVFAFAFGGIMMYMSNSGGNGVQQHQQVNAQDPTDTVATVNGEGILYHEYNNQLNSYLRQQQGQVGANQIVELKNSVLDNLIEQKIILQEADKVGIAPDISEETIEEQLDGVIEYYASSKEEFEEMLSQQGQTLDDVRKDIKEGMSIQMKVEGMIEHVTGDVEISDEDLLSDSSEVRASHILVRNHDKSDEEAIEVMEDLLAKLDAGEDFAKLAQDYSEDGSAQNGGDLGFFGKGRMVAPFEEKAFSLEVGEVSGLVETQFGYHIIKVTDRKDIYADDSMTEEKKQELLDQKEHQIFISWLDEVKGESDIEIKDKEINAFNSSLKGDYSKAIEQYKEVIKTNSNAYYIYHNLAQVHRSNDDLEGAISTFKEAIATYPDHIEFYINLAGLYQSNEDVDKAISLYEKALENDDRNPELRLSLGELYKAEGENDKAVAEFEKFSQLTDGDLMAQYRLANIYGQMGLEDKAQEQMEKIQSIQEEGNQEVNINN